MMCWCYWETIFTPVATTPKQVRETQLLQLSDGTQLKIILTEVLTIEKFSVADVTKINNSLIS